MLQHFITTNIIILTSSFLIFKLITNNKTISTYLHYIIQKTNSSFLYNKYQNQNITTHIIHTLTTKQSKVSPKQQHTIYKTFKSTNNTHNLNLTTHKYPNLHNTLQTTSTNYNTIIKTTTLLPTFNQTIKNNHHQNNYNSNLKITKKKFHYYLNLNNHYIYFYKPINIKYFTINN